MSDPRSVLRQYFGYEDFRPGQRELVEAVLAGRDVLGILPTGGGKSVCYQVPALALPGLALVISPLISLMQDQVEALRQRNIPAACLTSSMTGRERRRVLRAAQEGRLALLYLSPERLSSPAFLCEAASLPVSLLVVDEAHCVSLWGREFRPEYLSIRDFAGMLPRRPRVAAYTASATVPVRQEIIRSLGLRDPFILVSGFDRKNLYYEVRSTADKRGELLRLLARYRGRSGIIYCLTRRGSVQLTRFLLRSGIRAVCYHGGLFREDREAAQAAWQSGEAAVIVATSAFGMGIDKGDVRFVIHYQMPGSLEDYYQEAGRAGRDGAPADCILLYSDADIKANRFFIQKTRSAALRRVKEQQLEAMRRYAGAKSCLRRTLLAYFGESAGRLPANCASCSYCLGIRPPSPEKPVPGEDHALYRSLVAVRLALAKEKGLPPYRIYPDSALHDLAALRPTRMRDLLLMEGAPPIKSIKYGADLLREIRTWNISH